MTRRDPGLQPERTALAWRRTAMALVVNGAVLTRLSVVDQAPSACALALLALGSALAFALQAGRRERELLVAGRRNTHPAVPRAATLVVALLALASAVLLC